MRQWKRALCIFLSVVMFVTVGGRFVQTAFASELTNDSIKKKEEEIKQAKEEKKEKTLISK